MAIFSLHQLHPTLIDVGGLDLQEEPFPEAGFFCSICTRSPVHA
jgi:hypothetical protein